MKFHCSRKQSARKEEPKKPGFWDKVQDLAETKTVHFLNDYSLVFHIILSCALIFAIEWMAQHSFAAACHFAFTTPLRFLYNSFLIFTTLMIAYVFRRRWIVRIVVSVFWILLGVINGVILANRVTPFTFTDLKMLKDLLSMTSSKYITPLEEIAIVILLIVIAGFLIWGGIKGPKFPGKMSRVKNLIALGVCVVFVPILTFLAIEGGILAGYFGNLAQGYRDYGFVYSFTSSVFDTGMSRPMHYSQQTIDRITGDINVPDTTADPDNLPNIIFIQLETVIDPYELNFLEYSDDPMPTFHQLMKDYSSGYLTVPVVGAGTANTEFEALTGMGIQFFGLGEYPYKTVMKETACESIASDLGSIGYGTHAIHNNGGNFYSRAFVFSQMGFDSYTSKELMNITEYNELESWPTDNILIGETKKILDSTEDQSDFVYTITVQSHGSYPDYPVFEDPMIQVSGAPTEEENYQWEYYVNELYEVDQYIADLLDMLSQRDEKTLVVMYGDHLPTMGLENTDMNNGNIYQTTYATWNNFGMKKKDMDLYSYQLSSYFTNELGIHEGTMFRFHQNAMAKGTSLDQKEYIDNLELLQYDLLYGSHYAYGGNEPAIASDLIMGTQEVVIRDYHIDEATDSLAIYGDNFTPWSKVTVNGELVSTKYKSGTCVHISLDDIKSGDTFEVNQVGSKSTIFRTSNTFTFEGADQTQAADN